MKTSMRRLSRNEGAQLFKALTDMQASLNAIVVRLGEAGGHVTE
jgi:hypothetical protein